MPRRQLLLLMCYFYPVYQINSPLRVAWRQVAKNHRRRHLVGCICMMVRWGHMMSPVLLQAKLDSLSNNQRNVCQWNSSVSVMMMMMMMLRMSVKTMVPLYLCTPCTSNNNKQFLLEWDMNQWTLSQQTATCPISCIYRRKEYQLITVYATAAVFISASHRIDVWHSRAVVVDGGILNVGDVFLVQCCLFLRDSDPFLQHSNWVITQPVNRPRSKWLICESIIWLLHAREEIPLFLHIIRYSMQ